MRTANMKRIDMTQPMLRSGSTRCLTRSPNIMCAHSRI